MSGNGHTYFQDRSAPLRATACRHKSTHGSKSPDSCRKMCFRVHNGPKVQIKLNYHKRQPNFCELKKNHLVF